MPSRTTTCGAPRRSPHHALAIADDAPSQLAAHHLAGWIASFQRTGQDAERHLSPAEHLAERLGRTSQLASIRQARGLAWRTPDQDDPDRALAYLESAADTFAEAGDAMHVNNCLYMMAADTGRRLDEARSCIERFHRHAAGHGNRHEIAHAELTLARLAPESEIDLKRVTTLFRQVGDLRCLTRSYILLAERKPGDATHWLGLALETARAIDRPSQVDILRRLIATHGRSGARDQALQAFGELSVLVGRDQAEAACRAELANQLMSWQPAEADGRARAVSRG